jgi:hypothetical protein
MGWADRSLHVMQDLPSFGGQHACPEVAQKELKTSLRLPEDGGELEGGSRRKGCHPCLLVEGEVRWLTRTCCWKG